MEFLEGLCGVLRMNNVYLGIDTSNYTTSVAVVDGLGNVIADKRKLLEVKKGDRGLRQQEALFQHVKNYSQLYKETAINGENIAAVGVSIRPRNEIDSYMPVFLAGAQFGEVISHTLGVPLKKFSHQEGHAACVLIDEPELSEFLLLHISGGTTELISVRNERDNLYTTIIGGSLDISIGQLVDRTGVAMGYGFPSGAEMEADSSKGRLITNDFNFNIADGWVNLSGFENRFKSFIIDGHKREDISLTLFELIAELASELLASGVNKTGIKTVAIAGGVAENLTVRKRLEKKFKDNTRFTKKGLSADNAVGIAWLASQKDGWEV